jgi:hypothetical protein
MKTGILTAARSAFQLYPRLLGYWKLLVVVHITSYLASEALAWQQESVLQSGREDLPAIFAVFAGSMLVNILFATAWIIAVVRTAQAVLTQRDSTSGFFTDLNRALIESVRSLARSLRWLPVFIIPGLIKFVRLTFVPFIVVDQAAYKEGSVDALNESERLTKKRFWFVLFALLISAVLPSVPGLLFHAENISLASRPIASITWSVFEFFTSLLATAFLYCLYRQLVSRSVAD